MYFCLLLQIYLLLMTAFVLQGHIYKPFKFWCKLIIKQSIYPNFHKWQSEIFPKLEFVVSPEKETPIISHVSSRVSEEINNVSNSLWICS